MSRKSISKRKRFSVFARDGFTCRYCGRQPSDVILHLDHIIPVSKGGTNDPENLVTSCADCNLGKAATRIEQYAPNDGDRLRLLQEYHEQKHAAEIAAELVAERKAEFQRIVNFWCECSGRDSVDSSTIKVVAFYAEEWGEHTVCEWIAKAAIKCGDRDKDMGKYISGIRRLHREEAEA